MRNGPAQIAYSIRNISICLETCYKIILVLKHISNAFITTKTIFENKLISSFLVACLPGNAHVYTAASNFHAVCAFIFFIYYSQKLAAGSCVCLKFRWRCIVINSYNKTKLDALISQIYFWNKTLHVSDISSVHHQELRASCQQTCMTYTIGVCTVKNSWWWTEELSEICRVLFKNKFEKLVHLVGFIIRTCVCCI